MSAKTLSEIAEVAVEIERGRAKLDRLMAKARREGHTLREIGRAADCSNVTVLNRTKDAA